ncbi:MAG: hypothetical protein R2752_23800 [Vicinamibacterales bacterium]
MSIVRTLLLLAILGGVAVETSTQGRQRVPSLMQGASATSVLGLPGALAARGIPAGVVISADVLRQPAAEIPQMSEEGTLDAALSRFDEAHPGYRSVHAGGVVLVEQLPVPPVVAELLSRRHTVHYQAVPALELLLAVGDLLAKVPGSAGGGIAGTGPPVGNCPLNTPITVHIDAPTTRQILDAMVEQAKGLVWLMIHDLDARQDGLQLGFMCPNGVLYRFTVRGW